MNQYTARQIDTSLKASPKYKKALVFELYENPVIPISANTYKTGKHGHAKTRMLLRDFFKLSTFSIIVDSDLVFRDFELDGRYSVESGLIESCTELGVYVLNESYESIFIKVPEAQYLKKCSPDLEVKYISFKNPLGNQYKLKILDGAILN